jgi:hypothetical protein
VTLEMNDDEKNDKNILRIKEKRPPGRPRLKPVKKNRAINCISKIPRKNSNIVEFIYDEPMYFKKALHVFKHLSVNEININFDKDKMTMSAVNNVNTEIIVIYDCNSVNHYYCESPISVTLNALNVEKVNKVIDSDLVKVTLIIKRSSSRSNIIFIFQNDTCVVNTYEINLIQPVKHKIIHPESFNVDGYTIKFNITDKFFKKIVVNSSMFAELLILRKIGIDGNLTFSYSTDDKMIKSSYIINDSKFINLESTVHVDNIFNVSINIDYIKPIANAMISNLIRVNVDEHQNIVFIGSLDNDTIFINISCITETV